MRVHVALLVPEYRTDAGGQGGVAAVADFLASVFIDDAGWEVEIISTRMYSRANESRQLLSPVTWLTRPRAVRRASGSTVPVTDVGAHVAEFEAVRYLPRRCLDAELRRFDVVVIVAGSPAIALATKRLSSPVILQVATMVREERRRLLAETRGWRRWLARVNTWVSDKLDRRALRIPATVVVENTWMEEKCRRAGAQGVVLCAPGTDTDYFIPTTAPPAGAPYVIMVGRLADPRKDIPTLLRAYLHARRAGVVHTLVLAGHGRPSDQDLGLVDELGLTPYVKVLSDVPKSELVKLLQEADLFVSSSSEEGLGIALIEAMACGTPVVSTATAGATHVIADSDAGLLVQLGSSEDLGRAMAELLSDPRRLRHASLAARGRAEAVFSQEAAGAKFIEIIQTQVGSLNAS